MVGTAQERPLPTLRLHPTGKSVFAIKTCPALPQKIFRFRRRENQFYQLAPSHPPRGALAIVTNAGWDAVDATAPARKVIAGRALRLVSGSRRARRTALLSPSTKLRRTCPKPGEAFGEDGLRTAKPCGPDTRCWCQVERRRSQLNRA